MDKKFVMAIAVIGVVTICLLGLGKGLDNNEDFQSTKAVQSFQRDRSEVFLDTTKKSPVEFEKISTARKETHSTSSGSQGKLVDQYSNAQATQQSDNEITSPIIFVNSDYASYGTATLFAMADAGNLIAMQVLAVRFLTKERSEKNVQSAHKLLEKAIVYGSKSYPLQFLAEQRSSALLSSVVNAEHISEQEKRTTLIDTFTYYELAAMRGNEHLKASMMELYEQQYNLEPTPREWEQIKDQAISLYNNYEQRRLASGLGRF